MNTNHITSRLVLDLTRASVKDVVAGTSDRDDHLGDRIVPRDLRQWLARLRLLEQVPFCYLVPDSLLLPPESIRFFYVDRNWTDALIQGALSVGTVNSSDRAELEQLHRQIRDELDEEERAARTPPGEAVQKGPAGPMVGFLLRSRAVSGWPGLHVRAYRREVGPDVQVQPESHPDRLKLLRLERLAPAVMLALFDGVPAVLQIEEPRTGVQFGVRLESSGGANQFVATVIARSAATSENVAGDPAVSMSFRPGAPGVLNLRRSATDLRSTPGTNMGPSVDGAEFALQMIRFPYRQVFGDPSQGAGSIGQVFRIERTLSMAQLKTKFGGA